jgi:hypothetical protein
VRGRHEATGGDGVGLFGFAGYGSGFWKLSSGAEQVQPSPSPAAIVIEHGAG